MQSEYAAFVVAAYAVSALAIGGLILWVVLDGRARRAELRALDAGGVRRRSEQGGGR